MADPQGLFLFSGIDPTKILSASYTLSHGITPGVCTIQMAPQPVLPAAIGTLAVKFGTLTQQFVGCKIDAVRLRHTPGGLVWSIRIFDRRWRWRFGGVVGHYNLRNDSGELQEDTKKTPQELAQLLLNQMGEVGYNVSDLPNDTNSEVHWSWTNPATELAQLAESLGCRVVLQLNGTVALRRTGVGLALPVTSAAMNDSFGVDDSEKPSAIWCVCGEARFQKRFELEAVGKDVDGEIKLPDDLSYAPADWKTVHPETFTELAEDDEALAAARESMYRWYRIKTPVDIPTIEGLVEAVEITDDDKWRLMPLLSEKVETKLDETTKKQVPKPATVHGKHTVTQVENLKPDDDPDPTKVSVLFTIDAARGIVKFQRPVYWMKDEKSHPAELYLETSCPLRDVETREPLRYAVTRTLSATSGTQPQIVHRPEIVATARVEYDDDGTVIGAVSGVVDNIDTENLSDQANHYIDAATQEYAADVSGDRTYAGALWINPDGAIQQVTWMVNTSGMTTRASRNTEHNPLVSDYKTRRRNEQADADAAGDPGGPIRSSGSPAWQKKNLAAAIASLGNMSEKTLE